MADVREWAVVTGASSGLGQEFARRLAALQLPLVLVARRVEPMETLAAELRATYGIDVEVKGCDLGDSAARAELIDALADRHVGVLVNNAGFGTVGDFASADPARMEQEIALNCAAVALLARAFAPGMVAVGRGAIVNVASTAAYQPLPSMAVYAATKAFVLSLSEALWAELRPHGVSVLGLCPGATTTDFFDVAGDDSILRRRRSPDQVVTTAFDALAAGKPSAIDGPVNAVMAHLSKRLPVRVVLPISGVVLKHG